MSEIEVLEVRLRQIEDRVGKQSVEIQRYLETASPTKLDELRRKVVKCVQDHFSEDWFKACELQEKLQEEGEDLEYIHVTVTLSSLRFDRVIAQQWVGMYYTYKLRRKNLWKCSLVVSKV